MPRIPLITVPKLSRRTLFATAGGAAASRLFGQAPGVVQGSRPVVTHGVQSGDVVPGRAMVWSRADRPARMSVRWRVGSTGAWNRVQGPHCIETTDFTGRVELTGLPTGETVEYEVEFENLNSARAKSEVAKGTLRTAPGEGRDVRFVWTGDTCGQGWGIDESRGGMRGYDTMWRRDPDFFIHSGDTIYADGPILREAAIPAAVGGGTWRNVVTEEKSKVAETLDEFRGNYKYNLLDVNVRNFNSRVPQIWQWDDHEVTNNWSPSKSVAADTRYKEKEVPLMIGRATKAFLEYAPLRHSSEEIERVYRHIPYGPLVDVFVIDMRTYRGPNTFNRQENESADTAFLGMPQLQWLRAGLKASKAVWKVIAADMPLGLNVGDGTGTDGLARWEAIANGNGPALGRELEIASLLRYIKLNGIRNTVWFTADTHYTAAHYYNPVNARFIDFDPFWEFMSGPIHAGSFGPNAKDDTFGIEVPFERHPPAGQVNLPPSAGFQFFGEVNVSARTKAMTVTLRDTSNIALYTKVLEAQA